MTREFTARWPFTCACCGVVQPEGSLAQFGSDGVLRSIDPNHTDGELDYEDAPIGAESSSKAPEVMPRGKTVRDRCDRCFIIHASGQVDCY